MLHLFQGEVALHGQQSADGKNYKAIGWMERAVNPYEHRDGGGSGNTQTTTSGSLIDATTVVVLEE